MIPSPVGFMPLMKIYSTSPSVLINSTENIQFVIPSDPPQYNFSQFKWNREIPLKDAISKLERTMYPFKEVCNSPHLFHQSSMST